MYFGTRKYRFEVCREAIVNGKLEYHGRNCVLLVEIAGNKDPRSHMIMDLGDLDESVDKILKNYDHRSMLVSFETLTKFLYRDIEKKFPKLLNQVTLYETDDTFYKFYRTCKIINKKDKWSEMMDVTRTYVFRAGHRTHNYDLTFEENEKLYGKCNTLHGHEYKLQVTVSGEFNHETGVLIDENHMNLQVGGVIAKYHNKYINDVLNNDPDVLTNNATTENFIEILWKQLKPKFDEDNYDLVKLRLYETDRNYFDFYG